MTKFVPRRILVLGGTSDIGLAITERFLRRSPASVVLAARPDSARLDGLPQRLARVGATQVETIDFDALEPRTHKAVIDKAFRSPVDLAVVAFGVLGDPEEAWHDQVRAVEIAQVNYTAAVSVGVLLAERMSRRGRGVIVFLSSMAGEQVRRENFVYGSSKAGADAFYLSLADAVADLGVSVTVIRPGFVPSAMTKGLRRKPLAVSPTRVAKATMAAVDAGARLARVPAVFGPLVAAYKVLPPVARRRLKF